MTWSTPYEDLYQELQKRAALMTVGKTATQPKNIFGKMWVECWGEKHSIQWKNWVSETQHLLGIEGAKLLFEFQVIHDASKETSPKGKFRWVKAAKAKVKAWACLPEVERDGVAGTANGFELTDYARRVSVWPIIIAH